MRRLPPLLALPLRAALLYAGHGGLTASPEAPLGEGRLARQPVDLDSDACAVTLTRRFLANHRRAPRADRLYRLSPVQFAP